MRIEVRPIVAVAMVAFGIDARAALAQPASCQPISSLPTTIEVSGNYCLTQNLNATSQGDAIRVVAGDVVLDLGGFTILCAGACREAFFGAGVHVDGVLGNKNASVRNGTIRGFKTGILASSGSENERRGHVIERLRLDQNIVGVSVAGRAITVRDNNVFIGTGPGLRRGIEASGQGHQIIRNVIVHAGQRGTDEFPFEGILARSALVEGNIVSVLDGLGVGAIGITGKIVVENRVSGAATGVATVGGVIRDNIVLDATTPYSGGTDAGGNFPPP